MKIYKFQQQMCCEAQGVFLISGSIKHVSGCQLASLTCESDLPLRSLCYNLFHSFGGMSMDLRKLRQLRITSYHLTPLSGCCILHINTTKKYVYFRKEAKTAEMTFLEKRTTTLFDSNKTIQMSNNRHAEFI